MALCVTVAAAACATSTAGTTRDLPVGLAPLGRLLDGCDPGGSDGVVRMRCGGEVTFAVKSRKATAAEPRYRAEAYGMAQTLGGKLEWDRIVVATEGPSGLLDRARILDPATAAPEGAVIGTVRSVSNDDVQEVWCASPEAGYERCKALVGAFLSTGLEPPAAEASASSEGAAAPHEEKVPVTVFGRSLSVPTTCKAKLVPGGGDASCKDGVTMSWRRYGRMEDATNAVAATLDALGDGSEGRPVRCTIAGEPAQCEVHPRAVAGITYLDGKPLAVLCLGVADALHNSLCGAVMHAD